MWRLPQTPTEENELNTAHHLAEKAGGGKAAGKHAHATSGRNRKTNAARDAARCQENGHGYGEAMLADGNSPADAGRLLAGESGGGIGPAEAGNKSPTSWGMAGRADQHGNKGATVKG
jgi:hypothetical protein